MPTTYTNLDLVKQCDKFPYAQTEPETYAREVSAIYKFHVEGCSSVLGFMLPSIVQDFQWSSAWKVDHQRKTVLLCGASVGERDENMARTLAAERQRSHFKVLTGWRDELYPVYGPDHDVLVNVERAASPLFGVVTYGVQMTAYVKTDLGLQVWVPRRAATKQTYPGMLDDTVGGGISSGDAPFASVVREAAEEASFPADYVARNARCCGLVSYFDVRDQRAAPGTETGLLQPECMYVYDLEVPPDLVPRPNDNEAEDFRLLRLPELCAALRSGEFKTNCALVLIDFFVRHGIVTPEGERDYVEIVARLHRRLEFPCA
ncbi:thiamine pyrophosphokinase [Lasiosphaeria miniovina]|uniref:Thiamine pyrophosphokinase n=1 Tax=Lasiosphaeria miniovina TaxID=1954250 RepID=A0AA40BI21_9PEZI|nr:thiamine pyrophosphokinase [Lasiosphaeria miniovina]KAK0734627.1 thiamine pyrophosphokinase [Lasiosphaeria miniovina]